MLKKEVPLILVLFAEAAALGAEACLELRTLIFSGKFRWPESGVTDDDWFECFRDSRRALRRAFRRVFPSGCFRELLRNVHCLSAMQNHSRCWHDRVKAIDWALVLQELHSLEVSEGLWTRIENEANQFQEELIAAHERFLTDDLPDDVPDAAFEIPELQYFLRVWMPCVQEYGQTPDVLYRKASSEDLQSLCRLVRFDNRILREPTIQAVTDRWYQQRQRDKLKQLGEALQGSPEDEISPNEAKFRIVSQIMQLADDFRPFKALFRKKLGSLSKPDVHRLFDAIAHDRGIRRDVDLPEKADAFRKAVQRTSLVPQKAVWDIFTREPVPVF